MKSAFTIDYTFVPEPNFADVKIQNDSINEADIKFGYSNPFNFVQIQNYNPIYSLFFKMCDTNYNRIGLNHTYKIHRHQSDENWILHGPSGEVVEKPVFFKFSPLIDHITYMTKHIDLSGILLPNHTDISDVNHENRLLRHNNMAYTDGFFYYLSSKMLHTHNFEHGIDFYGSYVGIQSVFKFDMWDDMYDTVVDSKYFNENLGKKFFLNLDDEFVSAENEYSTWSRSNRPPLQFSEETVDPSELGILDQPDVSVSPLEDTPIITCDFSMENDNTTANANANDAMNDDDDDSNTEDSITDDMSTYDSNTEYSSTDDNANDDTNDDHTIDADDSENYTDDDSSYMSDFDPIEAYIPNYPVHVICIEKCEGLFEDLLKERQLDDSQCIAAMAQVVFALLTYQKVFHLTHNDLHTRNIMYCQTDKKYLYYQYNNTRYKVPTHGRIFKIIDFGRAIYKYRGKLFVSDSYSPHGEAEKLYNTEPYFDSKKKRVDPNPSFDLCRLATSIFDITETRRDLPVFRELINRWCMDDRGKNVYVKNGSHEERYPGFKLYKMIARTVHAHTPVSQLKQKEFKRFLYKGPIAETTTLLNIDTIPNYTM